MQFFHYLDERSTKGIKSKCAEQLEAKVNKFSAGVTWVKKHKPKPETEGIRKAVKKDVKEEKTKNAKGKEAKGKKKGTSKTVEASVEKSAQEPNREGCRAEVFTHTNTITTTTYIHRQNNK
jgi:hypothetical protein